MSSDTTKAEVPPLSEIRSCSDFEAAALICLKDAAREYIYSGEPVTMANNRSDFSTFMFRPKVLSDVSAVDIGTSIFGIPASTPFYLSSVAKGSLVAGKEGEAVFVRAAARAGTVYLCPLVSSVPVSKMWAAATPDQKLPFQYYLMTDEEESTESLQEAIELGARAVVVTVDANAPRGGSFGRATQTSIGTYPSPYLTWERLADLRQSLPSHMPLYLKGIQRGEDALRAAKFGVQGIVVSNHGGRSCDDACGSLSNLEEVTAALREAGLMQSMEVVFDSGVRSGRDALKALCLGATGIGLGRPYYWAAASHGEDGVVALIEILSAELRFAMAQIGASTMADLGPAFLKRREAPARTISGDEARFSIAKL